MTRSTIHSCGMILALALMLAPIGGLSTATNAYALEGGGGGGSGESDRSTPTTSKKKVNNSKKYSAQWNKLVADDLLVHAKKDNLGYYFKRASRLRRLLSRLYRETKEKDKLPVNQRKKGKHNFLWNALLNSRNILNSDGGVRYRKIISSYHIYESYRDKKITKNEYKIRVRRILDFVP